MRLEGKTYFKTRQPVVFDRDELFSKGILFKTVLLQEFLN
jgi:hypothetical protein